MDSIPPNHRLAERDLINLVRDGEWQVNQDGSIWRVKLRHGLRCGGSMVSGCTPRRAEKRLPGGYLMVNAMRDGKRIAGLAHRLVWQHFFGDIAPGMIVNHKNGLKDGDVEHGRRIGLR